MSFLEMVLVLELPQSIVLRPSESRAVRGEPRCEGLACPWVGIKTSCFELCRVANAQDLQQVCKELKPAWLLACSRVYVFVDLQEQG